MYKIGAFSKIVGVSVKTLRFYDQQGVLQPAEIDVFTGYRYYSDENIRECELIKLLKSLDFTLDEIISYKHCPDEMIIKKKKEELARRINILKLKYERLLIMEDEMKQENKIINNNNRKGTPQKKVLRR